MYGLGLIGEVYDTGLDWYHHYRLVKKGTSDGDVIDHLQLVFIELPKFPVHSQDDKKRRLLWLRFLREIDEKTKSISPDLLEVPEIAQAITLAEEAAYTPGELEAYQSYWDSVRREKTLFLEKYNLGKAEGMAEGEARGRAEAKKEIARKLLKNGMEISIIESATGLSRDEILS